jgi:hypothetical protein
VRAGTRLLAAKYRAAAAIVGEGQEALQQAVSQYNSSMRWGCTGGSKGEFEQKKFTPGRSIVKQHVGPVKTEKSKNAIP